MPEKHTTFWTMACDWKCVNNDFRNPSMVLGVWIHNSLQSNVREYRIWLTYDQTSFYSSHPEIDINRYKIFNSNHHRYKMFNSPANLSSCYKHKNVVSRKRKEKTSFSSPWGQNEHKLNPCIQFYRKTIFYTSKEKKSTYTKLAKTFVFLHLLRQNNKFHIS